MRKRRKTVVAIVLVIIVSSMGFSWTMRDYWKDKYSYNLMTEQTYNTGIYMKYTLSKNDMFIANKGYVSLRITAVSRIVSLPLGGASGASYNAQQLVYDKNFDLEIATIYSDIKPVKLDELTYATNEIFTFNDPGRIYDGELSWANILDRGCEDFGGKLIQDRFNIHYAVETHDLDGKYVFWVMYTSGFLLSVHELRYKIYDNSEEALWYV